MVWFCLFFLWCCVARCFVCVVCFLVVFFSFDKQPNNPVDFLRLHLLEFLKKNNAACMLLFFFLVSLVCVCVWFFFLTLCFHRAIPAIASQPTRRRTSPAPPTQPFPPLAHTNNHHLPSPSSVGILLLARKLSPFFLSASFFFFPCISRVALPCIPHSPFRQSLNPLQASNLTATVQSNKQKGLFWFCFFVFCFLLWWSWRSAQTLPLPFSPRRSLS